jgi:hypothetical protein
MPANLAEFAQLRIGQKQIKDLDQTYVKSKCAEIISRAFVYTSPNWMKDFKGTPEQIQKQADDILHFQSIELYNTLKGKLATLTLSELQKAFKIGLDGGTGQFFGMCGKTYHQFVNHFYNLPERSKAWLAYLEEVEKPDPVKHKFLPEREERTGCVNLFKRYKESGQMEQLSYAYYDTFCKYWGRDYKNMEDKVIKTICWDKEARINIFKRSMSETISDLKRQKEKLINVGDLVQAELIDLQFKRGLDDLAIMKHKQKKYMIQWFFESLIKEGVELNSNTENQ